MAFLHRWGLGLSLIIVGNIAVWRGALHIGLKATSGAINELKTNGLYRYSRNPQYVADIAILLGWVVLTASASALAVAGAGIFALAIAPFAEDPWLKKVYGKPYIKYCKQVRRYL